MNICCNEIEEAIDANNTLTDNIDKKKVKDLEKIIEEIENKIIENASANSQPSYRDILTKNTNDIPAPLTRREANRNDDTLARAAASLRETLIDDTNDKQAQTDEARGKLGIFPIKEGHIARFASKDHNLENVSNHDLFHSHLYAKARSEAAQDFLISRLKFEEGEIQIKETKMAHDGYCHILWITVTERIVKKIFQRAANVKDNQIQLLTYFPHHLYKRKIALEKLLRVARAAEPNLRTQIRLGKDDITLFTKYKNETFWQSTPLENYGKIDADPVFSPPRDREEHTTKRKDVSPPTIPQQSKKIVTSDYWYDLRNTTNDRSSVSSVI